jgi:DNA invertase Pin-like site-specific DNA recombinase
MTYGYIRVSTDRQTVENQKFEIQQFAKRQNIKIDNWIKETISGTKEYDKRKLGKLLKKLKKDDLMICSELSRLGRSLFMIMDILNICMKKEVKVWTIKDNYRLGDDIQSKVLAFAFGLSAEIERNLISQRTIEALKRKRADGVILGRPIGRNTPIEKLRIYRYRDRILRLYEIGTSYSAIGRKLKFHRITVSKFIKNYMAEMEV